MRPALLCAGLPLTLAACAAPAARAPSLAPRAAESIDPRVPVAPAGTPAPLDLALTARLDRLVAQARSGNVAFQQAAATAQRLAAVAGPRESESWTVAQQALSAAVAAQEPTARALGDVDALAAETLQSGRMLSAADLAAVQQASARIGEVARAQAQTVESIRRRLGG